MIAVGKRVRIQGLANNQELNYKQGICKEYNQEAERWTVAIEGTIAECGIAEFAVKSANLELVSGEALSDKKVAKRTGLHAREESETRHHSKKRGKKRKRDSRAISISDDEPCVSQHTPVSITSVYYDEKFLDAALLHRSFRLDHNDTRTRPRLAKGGRYTVGIMGLHGSGTHALKAYVSKYFNVDCEPHLLKKKDEGRLVFAHDFHIWKHTVPPFELPRSGRNGNSLVVLFTVREVRSWMCSRSQTPYELFPIPRRKRPQGRIQWMFGQVKFETGQCHCNPKPDLEFESVPHLWLRAVQGYLDTILDGAKRTGGLRDFLSITCRLVRYEDIVLYPDKVVQALEDFGLPRNSCKFESIEDAADKIGGDRTRTKLLEKLAMGSWDGSRREAVPHAPDAFTDSEAQRLRQIIQNDPLELIRVLDYALP